MSASTYNYELEGDNGWLTINGDRVMLVENASAEQMEQIVSAYQSEADAIAAAPPAPVEFGEALALAERHIDATFSPSQLIQLKNWYDVIPHENAPKLMATYQWTAEVAGTAAQLSVNFPPAPHSFVEIASEVLGVG